MGDKDPKSAHKHSRQKTDRTTRVQQAKDDAQAAKRVVKPTTPAPTPQTGKGGSHGS